MKFAAAAFALLLAFSASAQLIPPPTMALDMSVPAPPVPVRADGKTLLVYEVHLTNFRSGDVVLAGIDVLADGKQVATYDTAAIARPGLKPGADKSVLGGGMRAVVFVWASVDEVPKTLTHRVRYKFGEESVAVEGGSVAPSSAKAVALAPPLEGDGWVAAYGPSNDAPHRRTMLPLEGRLRIPQRFATDWVRAGADGRAWHGDPSKNENWNAYGANVLAVADAVVANVRDGLADIPPQAPPPAPLALSDAGGNSIALDLGDGRYAFYAHLQTGSIRVKKGDRVKRGQVIAKVGNTGNTMGPHLHFHVSDAIDALAAEGLPYTLTGFTVMGGIESSEKFEAGEPYMAGATWKRRTNEMPLGDMVVAFR